MLAIQRLSLAARSSERLEESVPDRVAIPRMGSAACRVLREVGTAKSLPALKAALAKAERERGTGPEVAKAAQEAITAIESR